MCLLFLSRNIEERNDLRIRRSVLHPGGAVCDGRGWVERLPHLMRGPL
eukprot:COSAG01_NODE_8523_length_2753_cov_37.942847_4_plen_48_part_00